MLLPSVEKMLLERYPPTKDNTLRAWNAADELLLAQAQVFLHQWDTNGKNDKNCAQSQQTPANILIINDQFGALTVALNQWSPVYWTDSFLSQTAINRNLRANLEPGSPNLAQLFELDYQALSSEQSEQSFQTFRSTLAANTNLPANARFDLILIRIPKHNSLLEFQLGVISGLIDQHTKVIAGGMTKEIHNSNLQLFERIIGETTTSLARKKARLIFATPHPTEIASFDLCSYQLPEFDVMIKGLPGVFSRQSLDMGTRVLLKYLPKIKPTQKVIDLGCGSGVIGAVIGKMQPDSELLLIDESQLAVASARLTFQSNRLKNGEFVQNDGLDNIAKNHYDYVLCNPPFHQQNVQTLSIASKMFRQSSLCLKSSGELCVVANRHLAYSSLLKRYFYQVKIISKDSKFCVWLAQKPKK